MVTKSFQTFETMENTINLMEEREFSDTGHVSIFRQLAITRSCLFRFFLVFAGSIDRSIDSFEFSTPTVHFPIVSNRSNHRRLCVPAIRRMTTSTKRDDHGKLLDRERSKPASANHDGCHSRATSLRTNHELFAGTTRRFHSNSC